MTHRLVKLVRGALLPTTLPQAELSLYGGWENKTELTGAWLTQIIHTVRFSHRLFEYVTHWLCAVLTWLYAGLFNFMPAIPLNNLSLSVASLVSRPGVVTMLCLLWRSQMICCRWSRICCWSWEFTASWWLCCTLQKVREDSVSRNSNGWKAV